jgi:hypothetical protein
MQGIAPLTLATGGPLLMKAHGIPGVPPPCLSVIDLRCSRGRRHSSRQWIFRLRAKSACRIMLTCAVSGRRGECARHRIPGRGDNGGAGPVGLPGPGSTRDISLRRQYCACRVAGRHVRLCRQRDCVPVTGFPQYRRHRIMSASTRVVFAGTCRYYS